MYVHIHPINLLMGYKAVNCGFFVSWEEQMVKGAVINLKGSWEYRNKVKNRNKNTGFFIFVHFPRCPNISQP